MRPIAVLAVLTLVLLSGCASSRSFERRPADEVRTGFCEQRTPEVFVIRGEIDAELATCVRGAFADTTRELVLDSMGGSLEAALDIVEVIENRRLTMRVEGECNSACANYFLPLAGRIVMSPDAMVLLHGSMDPWTMELWRSRRAEFLTTLSDGADAETAEADFKSLMDLAERMAARQAEFADRHQVRPGWLLYRTPGSTEVRGLDPQPGSGRAVLVEEPMMRSCLPGVEIEPFQTNLERHWTRSYRRLGLMWTSIAPSGRAVCRPS